MTLEQLRIFIAVAEREHVTRAAAALGLTPSAVSAAIAALESRHGVMLFDRIGRGITMTGAGREFLTEARATLARAAEAEAVLTDLAGLRRGRLSLAASQTIGNYWLPPLMHRYRLAHPGIGLELFIGNSRQVAAKVVEGLVDLGFIEGEVAADELAIETVASDDMLLVASPALNAHGADLAALPWVCREPGSGTRAAMEALLAARGLRVADLSRLELPSNEAVRSAVEAGAGLAVLSRLVVASALAAGRLCVIGADLPTRSFHILRHRGRHQGKAAAAFRQLIASAE
ncbi:LysR family transcriptional regulator [Zavarzinia sp.]|uniref:LysR family transcriptional regulator n=1 Tax=Zavarzinia sp. TaxID=2027920 RepID=UPI0035620800